MCLKSGSQLLCKDNDGEPFNEEVSLQGIALHLLLISWTLKQTFLSRTCVACQNKPQQDLRVEGTTDLSSYSLYSL